MIISQRRRSVREVTTGSATRDCISETIKRYGELTFFQRLQISGNIYGQKDEIKLYWVFFFNEATNMIYVYLGSVGSYVELFVFDQQKTRLAHHLVTEYLQCYAHHQAKMSLELHFLRHLYFLTLPHPYMSM